MTEVLKVVGLSKTYRRRHGEEICAVNNISFNIYPGEIVGFLGPNGAGKSTTIKMITGLVSPTAGDIYIMGHSVRTEKIAAITHVSGIIESPDLYREMSGYNNLKYFARLCSTEALKVSIGANVQNLTRRQLEERRIFEVLEMVGLSQRKNEQVKKYSLGMKQRLGIAQAMLTVPKLLILDEPANGLDPTGIRSIREILKYFCNQYNLSVFISSHLLTEMQLLCDRALIISNGVITADRNVNELNHDAEGLVVIKMRTDEPMGVATHIEKTFGFKTNVEGEHVRVHAPCESISQISKELIIAGFNIYSLTEEAQSLEDIYFNSVSVAKGFGNVTEMNMPVNKTTRDYLTKDNDTSSLAHGDLRNIDDEHEENV
ncbi:MAG: ABC transporter ATP-binding protein [Christensenellaceae bacterium]|jgi:ABC-2 type transport system ATP-binding protein|nr:ABC transporter ATP-binding protein [Christensenellaceae bacterium]